MNRLDPWTELQLSARLAARGHSRVAGVALVAERPAFILSTKDLTHAQAAHARTLNALKNLCLAWRDAPAEALPHIAISVNALCDVLDQWPAGDRAPQRSAQKRESYARAVPQQLHWMRD